MRETSSSQEISPASGKKTGNARPATKNPRRGGAASLWQLTRFCPRNQSPEQKRQDTTLRGRCQVVIDFLTWCQPEVTSRHSFLILLVALGYYPRLAEVVGDYPLHPISLRVIVKRTISYIFGFHKRDHYRLNGYPCQPLKKYFYCWHLCKVWYY